MTVFSEQVQETEKSQGIMDGQHAKVMQKMRSSTLIRILSAHYFYSIGSHTKFIYVLNFICMNGLKLIQPVTFMLRSLLLCRDLENHPIYCCSELTCQKV